MNKEIKPGTKFHVHISTRGVLHCTNSQLMRDWAGSIKINGKAPKDGAEIREAFMDELVQGHECIPFNEPCEGFDYKTGCPGHEIDPA